LQVKAILATKCGVWPCGRAGWAANVIVTEVDPLKALEAVMDGFLVMPLAEATGIGDLFVPLTGNLHVIRVEHFELMKDGAAVCNSGHFNVEIDLEALAKLAKEKRTIREFVEEYVMPDGRRIIVLWEGRLINLVAAEGHPASVMDMIWDQALSAEYAVRSQGKLEKRVYRVPQEIDFQIAALKLASMGVRIDTLTDEQRRYLDSWSMGT